jgi:hypothetical protein
MRCSDSVIWKVAMTSSAGLRDAVRMEGGWG